MLKCDDPVGKNDIEIGIALDVYKARFIATNFHYSIHRYHNQMIFWCCVAIAKSTALLKGEVAKCWRYAEQIPFLWDK